MDFSVCKAFCDVAPVFLGKAFKGSRFAAGERTLQPICQAKFQLLDVPGQ